MKKKVSLLLVAIMLFTTFLPIMVVNASEELMALTAKKDGTTLTSGQIIDVKTTDTNRKINVSVDVPSTTNLVIYYCWDKGELKIAAKDTKTATISIPNFEAGTRHILQLEAVINDHANNLVGNSNIVSLGINVPAVEEKTTISTTLKNGTTTLTPNAVTELKTNTKLTLKATSNKEVMAVAYKWADKDQVQVEGNVTEIIVPEDYAAGTTHVLKVRAMAMDGTLSDLVSYSIKIPNEVVVEPEKTTISVTLKSGNSTVSTTKDLYVSASDELDVIASCNIDVEKIVYAWDDGASKTINAAKGTITVPSSFDEGSEHTLTIYAVAKDGTKSAVKEYTIIIDDEYEIDDDDNELIIEPWMEENDDLNKLAVSLRNDSDEDKANKNIYELNEEVIYYVDYKNGGKDLKKSATMVLNVPETFKVVKSDGGTVSTSKGTITWNLGKLEEEESGTKTVVLKYTKIGSSKVTYKVIKPLAEIKVDGKVKDESAVINMIYKDKDTEIKDFHTPYMFGDAGKTTFRPNDTITRAEGALVLTRIFGISTAYDESTYNYPDLDETYLEARKAIIAATEYGIINGYEDGTYKPNKAMTRAEFLKIIANRVEIENDDGFEIKDLESSIKVYDDPTRVYVVGNEYLTQHWALEEVTLLARLNMTPLTDSNTNLRLDEPITRAEVAQLVNLYLLRAPAEVTSKTKTGFSDVNKNHKLFADIVEATREAHTYYITDETTEEAEY